MKFKVGDWVRITKDRPGGSPLKEGDQVRVTEIVDEGEVFYYRTKNIEGAIWAVTEWEVEPLPPSDQVNHPDHYKWLPVEAIDITEHFNFCMGNALKYIIRADHKGKPIEDLKKAAWYIEREIERRQNSTENDTVVTPT